MVVFCWEIDQPVNQQRKLTCNNLTLPYKCNDHIQCFHPSMNSSPWVLRFVRYSLRPINLPSDNTVAGIRCSNITHLHPAINKRIVSVKGFVSSHIISCKWSWIVHQIHINRAKFKLGHLSTHNGDAFACFFFDVFNLILSLI